MNPNVQLAVIVAGTLIPTMVGLLTARGCPQNLQTAVSAALSVIVGLASTWSFTGRLNWETGLTAIGFTFISALVFAHQIYKPIGVTHKIHELVPGGIGKNALTNTETGSKVNPYES
jgi:hypothetical protein